MLSFRYLFLLISCSIIWQINHDEHQQVIHFGEIFVRLSGKYVPSPHGEYFGPKRAWIIFTIIIGSYEIISGLAHSLPC